MQPQVLLLASMGVFGVSSLVMVSPFVLWERMPRHVAPTAFCGGLVGVVVSYGVALGIHGLYDMGTEPLALWWWLGGGILVSGIFSVTHGVLRRRPVALVLGAIAVVMGCSWS